MNIDKAHTIFKELEEDIFAQNLIAQANAKNILLVANEPFENFPEFTEKLDEKVNYIAFSYLSVGCTLLEKDGDSSLAIHVLEKAATILNYVHSPINNRQPISNYYLLISALSFYCSSQYSKSFIIINKIEDNTKLIKQIGLFLKKDFKSLVNEINSVLLSQDFTDTSITENQYANEANAKIYTVILSKALSVLMEFIVSGEEEWFFLAKDFLNDLKELTAIDNDPAAWWISRLFILILDNFHDSSLWSILPPLINYENTRNYIQNLAFNSPSIIELFVTQKEAVQKLGDDNLVISLPTSSGKTRIAEIAILDTLSTFPESKVLYLAPFRSLAFEIEESMDKTFSALGFSTTFLYGGSQYSKLDKTLLEHSNIIIATPEKAKAIIRADESIAETIKLLVIDEGHLLGASQRLTQNELFVEELKLHINANRGKIILLSAVLPNTKHISKWISGYEENVYSSTKRLADQRLGILKWSRSNNIDIEWLGETQSFNKNFIEKFLPPKAKKIYFPQDKAEGIAATALKLSKLGSVLLFVAQPRLVVSTAQRIKKAMRDTYSIHEWNNKNLFKAFLLACTETGESEILELAKYGILCHHGKLPTEVRLYLEKLMREEKPKVIVATSTLGQGVNIGISTVIFANVYINHQTGQKIDTKDFWNIAGRAGRAFTDIEGKILFAIDENQDAWHRKQDKQLIDTYYNPNNMEKAHSGLLNLIKEIKHIASQCNIDFQLLLELIAENDFSKFIHNGENLSAFILEKFNWLDDTLLAFDYKLVSQFDNDSSAWIDNFFRHSLAYIQAIEDDTIDEEDVLKFLKARNIAVINIAGHPDNWQSLVKSGIPLSSSVLIEEYLDDIKLLTNKYNESNKSIDDLIALLKAVELLIHQMPSTSFKHNFQNEEIENVRNLWLAGAPLSKIKNISNGQKICVEYFGMTIPWALNAIIRKLNDLELEEEVDVFENLALFSELGLPNFFAIKIYLSGIRSRAASLELSNVLNKELEEVSSRKLFILITSNIDVLKKHCSDFTMQWIKVFSSQINKNDNVSFDRINNFTLKKVVKKTSSNVLNVRFFENRTYLCSPTYEEKIQIKITEELPFDKVQDNLGIYFKYNDYSEAWEMQIRNPRLIVERTDRL